MFVDIGAYIQICIRMYIHTHTLINYIYLYVNKYPPLPALYNKIKIPKTGGIPCLNMT